MFFLSAERPIPFDPDCQKSSYSRLLHIPLFFLLLFLIIPASGQDAAGDYRTKHISAPTRDWDNKINWERFNGIGWVNADIPPGADNKVTIRTNSTYKYNLTESTIAELVVEGGGTVIFCDAAGRILRVNENLSGAGIIDMDQPGLSHELHLGGAENSIGSFISNAAGAVNYFRDGDQQIFASDLYGNLVISGSGTKTLSGNVTLSGELIMNGGNIITDVNILEMVSAYPQALKYSSGNILGKFKRWISHTEESYLYPAGTSENSNHATFTFENLSNGSLIIEFIKNIPGDNGLPLTEGGYQINNTFAEGYWSVLANTTLTSSNYSIELLAEGFETHPVNESTRVLKRISDEPWELDGSHIDASQTNGIWTVKRTGLSGINNDIGTQFGLSKAQPAITEHPEDKDICVNEAVSFTVTATGTEPFSYQWFLASDQPLSDDEDNISGSTESTLEISPAKLSDAGGYYCIVTDNFNNSTQSNTATLVVNAPEAPVSENESTIYDGEFHSASASVPEEHSIVWYTTETGGEEITVPTGTNAGTYTAWAEAVNDATGCRSATRTEVTLMIGQKELTVINAVAQNKVYDGNTGAVISGAQLSGVVTGDDVTLENHTEGTFDQAEVGTGINVTTTMTLAGTDAGNYSLAQPGYLEADITQKELTVINAVAQNKVYDANTGAVISGAQLSGVVTGDDVTLENHTAGTFGQAEVGTGINVTTTMTLAGTDAGNYSLAQPDYLEADITMRPITITVDPGQSKDCGQPDPVAFNYTLTEGSLAFDDEFDGFLVRESGEVTGAYEITEGSLTIIYGGTNKEANYNITFINAIFTINPNKEVITVSSEETILCFNEIVEFSITLEDGLLLDGAIRKYQVEIIYPINVDGEYREKNIDEEETVIVFNLAELLFKDNGLSNHDETVKKVIYSFTPYIELPDAAGFCLSGNSATIEIDINPQPVINVVPSETILCFDQGVEFQVSTLNDPETEPATGTWVYDITISDISHPDSLAGYTPGETGLPRGLFTQHGLENISNTQQWIDYTFTPRITRPGERDDCTGGIEQTIRVYVNPQPVVIATPMEQTICNVGVTDILLETPNVMTQGIVTFDYTAITTSEAGDVTGFTGSATNLEHGHRIQDEITNITNEVQYVTYSITPRALETDCADGVTVNVVIAINPTPKLSAEVDETIVCDSSMVTITVNDLLGDVHGSKVYELTTTDADENVTGVQPSGEYDAGSDITNQLVNLTNEVQQVTYQLRARIREPEGPDSGYCDNGNEVSITIYVNPTPVINVSISDTIYCDHSTIEFNITDLNGAVIGDKIFALTTSYESEQVEGVQPGGEYERIGFSNHLQNLSNQVQVIYYNFKPLIKDHRGPDTGYCSEGGDITVAIYLNPTPVATSDLFNDRDTICTNSLAEFQISSPTSVHRGVITFDFMATTSGSPGDLTGYEESGSNLPQNYTFGHHLTNHTNHPQYITYKVTPLALSTGCDAGIPTDVIVRVNPSPIDSFYISKEIECFGTFSGSVALETAIDSGPYHIRWTGPDGFVSYEHNLEDVRFGRYNLTVTDANNCIAEGSIRLANPDPIAMNFASEDVSCHGGSDGWIRITTVREGAGPPYTFEWTGPPGFVFEDYTIQDQYNLVAGHYTVVVTDGKGCQYVSTVYDPLGILNLSEPDPISVTIEATDATCEINDDGSATSFVEGGTGPYTYFWEGPEGFVFEDNTTPEVQDLTGGSYTLWVTDSKGCVSSAQTDIGELPPFRVTPIVTTNFNGFGVSCYGSSDAIVELDILGEYPPFNFQWSDGSTNQSLTGVPAGEYHVHVTDAVNCPSEAIVIVTEPDPILMSYTVEDVSCHGYSDGRIYLDVRGGTGNLNFNWQDGQASNYAAGLTAGENLVRISDANNCILDTIILVNEPAPLFTYPVISQPFCEETYDGSIELNLSGGTSPYRFTWSTGHTTENIYDIREDVYYVTVEDANNCIKLDTIRVESENEFCMRIPNAFTPNDDGFNDYWVIGSREAGTLGEIYPWAVVEVYNRLGELVYRSRQGYSDPWDGTSNGRPLPMDSYFYVIFRNNGQPPIMGHVTIIR